MSESTFCRHRNETTRIDLYTLIAQTNILKKEMREKHIVCIPELKELISEIDLFDFD